MKTKKSSNNILLAMAVTCFISTAVIAKTIDVSQSIKDIKVMTGIMKASLESSGKDFPGHPHIEGIYLANQGYLFNIRLNGIRSFGVPGIAFWERGRLELDIPELITNVLSNLDYDVEFEPLAEPLISSFDHLYDNEELQETLKQLRKKQRESRRKSSQLRRDIRQMDDEKQRQSLEIQLEKNQAALQQYSTQYKTSLNSYKTQRNHLRVKKSQDAINAVFATLCDYGQSLRALRKNEKFTLMFKGGVDGEGKKATQVYVIDQSALKTCGNSQKLKNNAIHYNL